MYAEYDDPETPRDWESEISKTPKNEFSRVGSEGGRSGAADINKPQLSPSVAGSLTSSINDFLAMIGGRTPGSRPQNTSRGENGHQSQQRSNDNRNVQYLNNYKDNYSPPGNLYDVIAPSGALGIVVDTTKDGPAVHSLKSNSPMLGLMNPGDLIVGLDNKNTRNMTAATLMRLMARKSSQQQRKITLLSNDSY